MRTNEFNVHVKVVQHKGTSILQSWNGLLGMALFLHWSLERAERRNIWPCNRPLAQALQRI